jgi:hypothetical protein
MDKADEEFYLPRAKMLREYIDTEGIPLEEKRSLWYSTYMLAQGYEREKVIGSATKNISRVAEIFGEIGYNSIEAGKINDGVQQTVRIVIKDIQINTAEQKPILETIERDTKLGRGIEKNLGKVDLVITAETITKGMRNQK